MLGRLPRDAPLFSPFNLKLQARIVHIYFPFNNIIHKQSQSARFASNNFSPPREPLTLIPNRYDKPRPTSSRRCHV